MSLSPLNQLAKGYVLRGQGQILNKILSQKGVFTIPSLIPFLTFSPDIDILALINELVEEGVIERLSEREQFEYQGLSYETFLRTGKMPPTMLSVCGQFRVVGTKDTVQ